MRVFGLNQGKAAAQVQNNLLHTVRNLFTPISTQTHADPMCFHLEMLTLKRHVVFLV